MKIKYKAIFILVIMALLIGAVTFVYRQFTHGENIYLCYGDNFSNVTLYTEGGGKMKGLKNSKTHLVFYLSDSCQPCIELLEFIAEIEKMSILSDYSIDLIWANTIPIKKLEKYNFKNVTNYTLNGKLQLVGYTPYFYVIKNNLVEFETNDTEDLIKMILNKSDFDYAKSQTYEEICNTYNYASDETALIFLTEDCEACTDIDSYIDLIRDEYEHFLFITNSKSKEEGYIIDNFNVFKQIFAVNSFPSIYVSKNNVVTQMDLNLLH